jgi:hypothetical protein
VKRPGWGTIAGTALVLAVIGWRASKFLPSRVSPFTLWVLTAGRPFDDLNDEARKYMRHRFLCTNFDLRAAGKLCKLETDGPPGTLSLVVDTSGRAIVVAFRSADQSAMLRDEIRKVMAEWNKVAQPRRLTYVDAQHQDFAATQWQSRDGRWTATVHLEPDESKPETAVTLRDERALAAIYLKEPLVQLAYHNERLINPLNGVEQLRLASLLESRNPAAAAPADTTPPPDQ